MPSKWRRGIAGGLPTGGWRRWRSGFGRGVDRDTAEEAVVWLFNGESVSEGEYRIRCNQAGLEP